MNDNNFWWREESFSFTRVPETLFNSARYSWLSGTAKERNGVKCWKKLPRLCAKLGIGTPAPGTNRGKGKSVHKLRKYYISKLIDAHVDPILITLQTGHTDIGTSYNFYCRNTKSIQETMEKLMPVLGTL